MSLDMERLIARTALRARSSVAIGAASAPVLLSSPSGGGATKNAGPGAGVGVGVGVDCHTPISRTSPTARASSARIEPVSQNRRKALFKSRFTTDSHDRGVSLEESIHLLIPVLVLPFPLPLLPLLHKLRLPLLHKLRPIVRL